MKHDLDSTESTVFTQILSFHSNFLYIGHTFGLELAISKHNLLIYRKEYTPFTALHLSLLFVNQTTHTHPSKDRKTFQAIIHSTSMPYKELTLIKDDRFKILTFFSAKSVPFYPLNVFT